MSRNSFIAVLSRKLAFSFFLVGKLARFGIFFGFLYFLLKGVKSLAGYSLDQTIFFYLTFNIVDIAAQFLFRSVYSFRGKIVSGEFDLILSKPSSALFRSLMGGADVIDLVTIPPLVFAAYLVGRSLSPDLGQTTLYIFLLFNALLVATAFHIVVISLGIITLEVDHTIMIYRDLVNLGRLPIDIYREPLKGALTYFIPVAVMITIPAKSLMGMVSARGVLISFFVGVAAFVLASKFWKYALRFYTSASS